ncbi:hypothetical protein [Candidatus Parabeggiatoa sp. HSG14]|uniref:hypothetical protein n=1 Tax=Candidatus Parabeggiatoa sp. HSG14 TaxID=3055593 RepID=UPI0025A76912|nr:hypothetical protein [Thiotrichales bacterium HSG14]
MKIDFNGIIQYAVFFTIPFLLMGVHSWLIRWVEPCTQQLTLAREVKEKIGVSLALFTGTVLFMLSLASSLQLVFNTYGLLAITFTLISSFFITSFFLSLLKEIRCQRIFLKFLINRKFLFTLFFILATELLMLYWLKEVNIYVREQFIFFVVGYSVLIVMGGIFLGFPKYNWPIQRNDWYFAIIAVIDPIIVVFFAWILVKILLSVFYNFLYI